MRRLTSILLLTLLVMAAAYGQVPATKPAYSGPGPGTGGRGWYAAFVTVDGGTFKMGDWNTLEECMAELPKIEKEQNVTSGQCFKTQPHGPAKDPARQ